MSQDDKWTPLSFEEQHTKMYPNDYHIFESFQNPVDISKKPDDSSEKSDLSATKDYKLQKPQNKKKSSKNNSHDNNYTKPNIMSQDDEWKPLSFEEQHMKMYPNDYHIFKNFQNPVDISKKPEHLFSAKDYKLQKLQGKDKLSRNYYRNNNNSSDESDEDIKKFKQQEKDRLEQINDMIKVGIFPHEERSLNSNKTLPCFTENKIVTENGFPIIYDDNYFKFSTDPLKISYTDEITEKVQSELSKFHSNSSKTSSSGSISKTNAVSNNSKQNIHEFLKIDVRRSNVPNFYDSQFPAISGKKSKKKK